MFGTQIVTRSSFIDLDTHRLICTLCGKIEYYSNAAREWFEGGIPQGYPGLGEIPAPNATAHEKLKVFEDNRKARNRVKRQHQRFKRMGKISRG